MKTYKIHWYGWECKSIADVNSYTNSRGLVTCNACLKRLHRIKLQSVKSAQSAKSVVQTMAGEIQPQTARHPTMLKKPLKAAAPQSVKPPKDTSAQTTAEETTPS